MLTTLSQLLPISSTSPSASSCARAGIAERAHGDFLLRFVFFVTLPLLILTSVSAIEFTAEKAVLPLLNIGVNLGCFALTLLLARWKQLNRETTGTLLVGTTIVNNSFMFPFTLAVYGEAGFADAILWDFGNAIMMATFVYALAFRYGGEEQKGWGMLLRILKSRWSGAAVCITFAEA